MATAAAAVVAQAKRAIQHHFFAADAVRPDRAVAFVPATQIQRRQFERMLASGIIRQDGANRYWLDVVAYDDERQRHHRQARTLLLVLIAILAAALVVLALQ